jgi:Helix-loop-helix DNA-binding domain
MEAPDQAMATSVAPLSTAKSDNDDENRVVDGLERDASKGPLHLADTELRASIEAATLMMSPLAALSKAKGKKEEGDNSGASSNEGNGGNGNNSENSAALSFGNNSLAFNFDSEGNSGNSDSDDNRQTDRGKDATANQPQMQWRVSSSEETQTDSSQAKSTEALTTDSETKPPQENPSSDQLNRARQAEEEENAGYNTDDEGVGVSYEEKMRATHESSSAPESPVRSTNVAPMLTGSSSVCSTTETMDGAASQSSKRRKTKHQPEFETDAKREERNAREKERSFRIKERINELRECLSQGGVAIPKGTKSSVLVEAANYIRMLQEYQYRSEM